MRGRSLPPDPNQPGYARLPWRMRVGLPALWVVSVLLATGLCLGGLAWMAVGVFVVAWIGFVAVHERLGWTVLAPRVEHGDLVLAGERLPVGTVRRVRAGTVWSSDDDDSTWLPGIVVEGERTVIVQTRTRDEAFVAEAACRDLLGLPDPPGEPVVLEVYARGTLRSEPLFVQDGPRPAGLFVEQRPEGLAVRIAGTRLTAGGQTMDVLDIERVEDAAFEHPSRPAVLLHARDGRRWYLTVARQATATELARAIEREIARVREEHASTMAQRSTLPGRARSSGPATTSSTS